MDYSLTSKVLSESKSPEEGCYMYRACQPITGEGTHEVGLAHAHASYD